MSFPRGPLRIVLLRSGTYDYAELQLHEPLHLVAANNVGKTSLIAALQFLYIDDARHMHFAHDLSLTRKHYFPWSGSLVLFECMTPTGLQVYGLRGLGPVQGYEYVRFAYNGEYRRDDYLDPQRQPRAWDDVARRLIDRELRELDARQLRASLTGNGDANGAALRLVPLKRSGNYESFRFLFRNLLRLSKIEQDQLKRLFIDTTPNLRRTAIDLRKEYSELFHDVERQAQSVSALRSLESEISELLRLYEGRLGARRLLAATWRGIERGLASELARFKAVSLHLDEERTALRAEAKRLASEQDTALRDGGELSENLGRRELQCRQLEALRDKTKSFVPELEAPARARLQQEYDSLVSRLQTATQENRARVQRQLRVLREQLAEDAQLFERFGDSVVTWLRAHSGLDDHALGDVFSVLDPSLLKAVIDDGRVSVFDKGAAISLVRQVYRAFDDDGFSAFGVRVRRRHPDEPSPLADCADVEVVKRRMEDVKADEIRVAQSLADIADREQLQASSALTAAELRAATERLRDWENWTQRAGELTELSTELEGLRRLTLENRTRVKAIGDRLTEGAREDSEKKRLAEDARKAFEELRSQVERLHPAPADWNANGDAELAPDSSLDELVHTYKQNWEAHREVSKRVQVLFAQVQHKTAEQVVGATDDETIDRLRDSLAAIEDRDRAVRELWASLVDGMRNAFKSLLDGVAEIRREVSRLTSALGRRQVSNLERVELELVPQRELIQRLNAVIEADQAPLFAGPDGRSRAALDVKKWLEDRAQLDLAELFDLRFKVVDARGRVKSFDSLSQIESQGTSTTIKVLVHLELLRTMLADDDVSLPFFLDEVATLDGPNLRSLIDHASHMGFVPVVASPEARDCVDTLYFLRPGSSGLVLDETSRVSLRRVPTDAT